VGRLTFTGTLAAGIKHLIDSKAPFGTYNLTNDGEPASWAEIAKHVFVRSGKSPNDVTAVTTQEYYSGKDGIAPRPLQSAMDLSKLKATGFSPDDWRTQLDQYLKES
jgi:dTDP-4-dehydrorhamnose 3,5-epimerase